MSTLFISDLHLSDERPDIVELFLQFMEERAPHAQSLYILGDFFEVWIGDDYIAPELEQAINALKRYTDLGNHLFFIHGNRDFLVHHEFEKISGCKILADPSIIQLNGINTLISHGDMLCTDDEEYMDFRNKVRNSQWQERFLQQPVKDRLNFATEARKQSRLKTRSKPLEIMDVNQSAVIQLMQDYEVTQMIHGHTHRPAIHHFMVNDRSMTRIVLGDWYEQGSVLEFGQGEFDLQSIDNEFAPEYL